MDVLDIDQLRGLMSNLPKDHPISMQFVRDGTRACRHARNDACTEITPAVALALTAGIKYPPDRQTLTAQTSN